MNDNTVECENKVVCRQMVQETTAILIDQCATLMRMRCRYQCIERRVAVAIGTMAGLMGMAETAMRLYQRPDEPCLEGEPLEPDTVSMICLILNRLCNLPLNHDASEVQALALADFEALHGRPPADFDKKVLLPWANTPTPAHLRH